MLSTLEPRVSWEEEELIHGADAAIFEKIISEFQSQTWSLSASEALQSSNFMSAGQEIHPESRSDRNRVIRDIARSGGRQFFEHNSKTAYLINSGQVSKCPAEDSLPKPQLDFFLGGLVLELWLG